MHLTPEIGLHLITPACRLFHKPVTADIRSIFQNDPFWAFYWPGGQAISRYILDHPSWFQNKTVLDVGSGCGASSLAAIKSGAKTVTANDIDAVAGCALYLNAKLNKIAQHNLSFCAKNRIGSIVKEDVMLLGDLCYDAEFADLLLPWLFAMRTKGKQVFVGDPGRHGLTEQYQRKMEKLKTYELTENSCIENNGYRSAHVWRLI